MHSPNGTPPLPQMTTPCPCLAAQAMTQQMIGRSLCPFRWQPVRISPFGCVLLSNHIYLTTMCYSTIPLQFIWSICPGKYG